MTSDPITMPKPGQASWPQPAEPVKAEAILADIPPPPPGWAIVPADDARLDCLPTVPMIYNIEYGELKWYGSIRSEGSKVSDGERRKYAYALPIKPPASPSKQAAQPKDLPPLAFVTFESGDGKYIQKASEVHGATLIQVEWVRTPTDEEKYAILPQVRPSEPEPQPWSLPAPPAGQAWHRRDWTAEMLPEGCRPLLFGERWGRGDEIKRSGGWEVGGNSVHDWFGPTYENTAHCRTRRPLPASEPAQGDWQAVLAEAKAKEAVSQANNPIFSGNPLVFEGKNPHASMKAGTDPKGQAGAAKPPLGRQEGGSHYATLAIQPVEFITANKLTFLEGCVIKRLCRHRAKGKAEDIRKAIHELELILALEYA